VGTPGGTKQRTLLHDLELGTVVCYTAWVVGTSPPQNDDRREVEPSSMLSTMEMGEEYSLDRRR